MEDRKYIYLGDVIEGPVWGEFLFYRGIMNNRPWKSLLFIC